MFRKIYLLVVGLFVCGFNALAQNNTGAIKVLLKDKGNNEAIPFANVVAYQGGVQVGVGTTNMDGECFIKPLSPGKYDVKGVYVGYQASEVKGVLVGEGRTAYITIALSNGDGVDLQAIDVIAYQVPLVDPDTKSGAVVDREQYQNMATKNINSVAATTAGVFQADEGKGLNVRGGRENSTTYFVDGIKVLGGSALGLPQQSVDQIAVITGGLPAMYGDATSGVVSITTRGPQGKFFGGVELISSQLTDAYGYNSLGFSVGGPILTKTDSTGVKTPILGFFLSGQGNYEKDPSPSAIPLYKLKDSKLKEIQETPLVPSRSGIGFNRALEYVTNDDFDKIKSHQNIANRTIVLNGKIDWKAGKNTNITVGGALEYSNNHRLVYSYSLFNAENNPNDIARVWRAYARITQKFGNQVNSTNEKEKSQALITNPFFSFLASFEQAYNKSQDDTHKDKLFNYGYIGKFNRTYAQQENIFNYTFNPKLIVGNDTVKAWQYLGRRETSTTYEASDLNYNMSRYTSYLYENMNLIPSQFKDASGSNFGSLDYVGAFGGLRNGDQPQSIYSLWNATGNQFGSYGYNNNTQFRIASSFNADVKNHALTLGVEYDQRDLRGYSVGAQSLWTKARLLANSHTTELDLNNPILNPGLSGTYPAYYYNNLYNASTQSEFSMNLLEKMGLPKNYTGFVNVDALDPSMLNVGMFSAEELLGQNSGSQLVDYFGYDYKGNKTTGSTNLNEFLNAKDANGFHTFQVGSFKPIYMAGYIQDKFDFKDIKFNVGLRVDRYDANQKMLKDQYLVYTAKTVGETRDEFTHPGAMGADYVVYTSQLNGGAVTGYRNGDQWYDAKGSEISDPNALTGSSGKVNPYLTTEGYAAYLNGTPFMVDAFKNYKAQVNLMPRIAFSFPISDVANFFAHYDVLTRRPGGVASSPPNRFDPKDYYFLQNESSLPFLNNPGLRPERTVDYEIGFNQILNERKNAKIGISAFYREMRDMLTQKQIVAAFPRSYLTYVNQDFGTVKGMSVDFDFRRTGGSRINANYTLQFAEGSGSNSSSGANLAASGQPNLRVTQPLDYDQRHSFVLSYEILINISKV